MTRWNRIGRVGCDAATIFITDPYEVLARTEEGRKVEEENGLKFTPLTTDDLAEQDRASQKDFTEIKAPKYYMTATSTPHKERWTDAGMTINTRRDGFFPVLAQFDKDGRILAVTIVITREANLPAEVMEQLNERDLEEE